MPKNAEPLLCIGGYFDNSRVIGNYVETKRFYIWQLTDKSKFVNLAVEA